LIKGFDKRRICLVSMTKRGKCLGYGLYGYTKNLRFKASTEPTKSTKPN